jgi:predicted RNase H-like HicB family nuclease
MHNEFTAIVERDEDWFIAYCPEIPGANGQGKTKDECLRNLGEAIDLIIPLEEMSCVTHKLDR